MLHIHDSVFAPVASQLLFFLAFPYAEVRLANLVCDGVIQFQFAVSFKCNNRYLRSGAWQGPLFVNPVPNRVCYCLCPLFPQIWG